MLKISHLQKNYRGFSLDCSMEVQPGMITGLIGRNGSGKSTTFKALLGLIHPDGGEIEVFGKKAEELKPEDKNQISHRGRALTEMYRKMKEYGIV